LPDYLDMFGNWERNDLQRRRYQKLGRLPASQPAGATESANR
jgi:hypothetical protein